MFQRIKSNCRHILLIEKYDLTFLTFLKTEHHNISLTVNDYFHQSFFLGRHGVKLQAHVIQNEV